MEKTIREVASELNISKEAIYRKVNHSMKDELADYIIKKDGKTYISEIGQSIIYQSLKREKDEIQDKGIERLNVTNNQTEVSNNISVAKTPETLEYIRILEQQINLLQTRYDNEINNNKQERETLYKLNQSLIDIFNREQNLQIAEKTLHIHNQQITQREYVNEQRGGGLLRKNIFKRFLEHLTIVPQDEK